MKDLEIIDPKNIPKIKRTREKQQTELPLLNLNTANINKIRRTKTVKRSHQKHLPILRRTNIPFNTNLTTPISLTNHHRLTNTTSLHSLKLPTLQHPATTNTEPNNNMKTLNANPNRSMIKLIKSSTNNGLALLKTLNQIIVLSVLTHFPTFKTTTRRTIATLMHTRPTNIKTTTNKT